MPRPLTVTEAELLAVLKDLHRWIHSARNDAELIELGQVIDAIIARAELSGMAYSAQALVDVRAMGRKGGQAGTGGSKRRSREHYVKAGQAGKGKPKPRKP